MLSQNKQSEKNFFNSYARERKFEAFTPRGYRRLADKFFSLISPQTNEMALELGSGTGAFTKLITTNGLKAIGVDISLECINRAKQDLPQIDFIVNDIEMLSLKDDSADIIIFSAVLHHLPDLLACLQEAYRVLKKGGRCFAFEPNLCNPVMWLFRYPSSPFYYSKDLTVNERLLDKDELSWQFTRAGLRIVHIEAISGIAFKTMPNFFFRLLLPVYNLLDKLFAKTSFSKKRGVFLTVFAIKK